MFSITILKMQVKQLDYFLFLFWNQNILIFDY